MRRAYYDHEPVYQRRRGLGYTGWNPPAEEEDCFSSFGRFLSWATFLAPGRVLDLGCGGGELCVRLAQEGWEAVGVDFSETAISLAQENARKAGVEVTLAVADITQPLPVEPNTFSLVVDNHVRHCLIEKEHRLGFMQNAYRALREEGWMFSANMSAEGYLDYDGHEIDRSTRIDAHRTRYWARLSELLEEFDQMGFTVQRIELQQDPLKDDGGGTATIYASRGVSAELRAFWGMERAAKRRGRV